MATNYTSADILLQTYNQPRTTGRNIAIVGAITNVTSPGGIVLTLVGARFTTPVTATTDVLGNYFFAGLQPDTYTITPTPPSSYVINPVSKVVAALQPGNYPGVNFAGVPIFMTVFLGGPPASAIATGVATTDQGQTITISGLGSILARNGLNTGSIVGGGFSSISAGSVWVEPEGLRAGIANVGDTQQVLWNRDLTNAAWTASNCIVSKSAIGVDGSINSASTISATGANATVSQAVGASGTMSLFLRRRVGTGAVSFSPNNSNFRDVTAMLAAANGKWFRTWATATASTIVIKLATPGDIIDVDYVHSESPAWYVSPPTGTTSSGATEPSSVATVANPIPANQPFFASVTLHPIAPAFGNFNNPFNNNNAPMLTAGTTFAAANTWAMVLNRNCLQVRVWDSGAVERAVLSDIPNYTNPANGISLGFSVSGGQLTAYINGTAVGNTACSNLTAQPAAVGLGNWQQTAVNSNYLGNYALSDIVLAPAFDNFLVRPGPQPSVLGFLIGDSITKGATTTGVPYAGYVQEQAFVTSGTSMHNIGEDGATYQTSITANWTAYGQGKGGKLFTMCGGINDLLLTGASAATIEAAILSLLNSVLAESGCTRVVVTTIVPGLNWNSAPQPGREPDLLAINTYILTLTGVDSRVRVVDIWTALRDPGTPTNYLAIYDSGDHLHPSNEGHLVIGNMVATALTGP